MKRRLSPLDSPPLHLQFIFRALFLFPACGKVHLVVERYSG
jgi:hypothetical protein